MSGPATAEWVHWYNTVRPHCAIGMRTPAEHEAARVPDTDHQEQPQPTTTGTNSQSLHKTRGLTPRTIQTPREFATTLEDTTPGRRGVSL